MLLSAGILLVRVIKAVVRGYKKYQRRVDAYKKVQMQRLLQKSNPQDCNLIQET